MSKRKEDEKEPQNTEARELWLDDTAMNELSQKSSAEEEHTEEEEEE
jgi:hypothetical protein